MGESGRESSWTTITVREGIMTTCIALLLTASSVLFTFNGVFAKSIDNSAGDYFLDLFVPQTEQRLRAHNAYWDERGRAHAEYWKAFFPNAVDILLKVPSAVINGVTTMMTAVAAMQPLLNPTSQQQPAATRPPPTNVRPTWPVATSPQPSRPSITELEPEAASSESDYDSTELDDEHDSADSFYDDDYSYENDEEEAGEGSGEEEGSAEEDGSGEEDEGTRAGA